MHWQDIVLTGGSLIFTAALIPSIVSKDKPALATSLLTAVVLTVFAFVYASLSLAFSTFSTSLVSASWYLLAIQKYLQDRNGKP